MLLRDFWYSLPEYLIAQRPIKNRHDSRLLVYERGKNEIQHAHFNELKKFLLPGDLLVINTTRVIPARILGRKKRGGKVEILLIKKIGETVWEVLVGGKNIHIGSEIIITKKLRGIVENDLIGAHRVVNFNTPIEPYLPTIGQIPLPPYIHEELDDPERYQTVFARDSGSAAAPTAGLHFTEELIHELASFGINFAEITLHVGLDTFAPVKEHDVQRHKIHSEWCRITQENADKINSALIARQRVIAVGTTTARTLESAAVNDQVVPFTGQTNLFILPGYKFKIINGLITNFHLPGSTLLMLVSAFAGRENILRCYQEAIEREYRFYSFGDAMLIL